MGKGSPYEDQDANARQLLAIQQTLALVQGTTGGEFTGGDFLSVGGTDDASALVVPNDRLVTLEDAGRAVGCGWYDGDFYVVWELGVAGTYQVTGFRS